MTKEVVLKDWQLEHYQRLHTYIQKSLFIVDLSVMGTGKTYVNAKLAIDFNFPSVIVICPASVESVWKKMRDDYGLKIILVTSYDSLRSVKGSQPKHGFLRRADVEGKINFIPTPQYLELVKRGVFLIFDEFQKIRNSDSAMYKACKALISPFINGDATNSRVSLLSGTPFNKEEHPLNLMKLVGIIREKLYTFHKETGYLELQGAQQLIDYCKRISPAETQRIVRENPITTKTIKHVCYILYKDVIQSAVSSSMPRPPKPFSMDVFNGYFRMRESDKLLYMDGIRKLQASLRYNKETGKVDLKNMNMGAVKLAEVQIEKSKVHIFVRQALKKLRDIPSCKIIISVNYKSSVKSLQENLRIYNPIIFTGDVNKNKRAELIAKFQEHNLNNRVFISTLRTGAVGISLDDTSEGGIYPRYAFGSPSYMVMDIQQWTGRVLRPFTSSQPHVCLVYGRVDDKNLASEADLTTAFIMETSVSKALHRGGTVFEETLPDQVREGIIFPNKYPIRLEDTPMEDIPFIDPPIPENINNEDIEEDMANMKISRQGVEILHTYEELNEDNEEDDLESTESSFSHSNQIPFPMPSSHPQPTLP